jgi:membrane protease YdiL (CAAX protease family)
METLIEALALYCVIFLPGIIESGLPVSFMNPSSGLAPDFYDYHAQLLHLFVYSLPALLLLGLAAHVRGFQRRFLRSPRREDAQALALAFPCLIALAVLVSVVSNFVQSLSGLPISTLELLPASGLVKGWKAITICIVCSFATAYLEESFFRFYLLSRFEKITGKKTPALIISVLLFMLCHLYEGFWGLLNAFLAATVLSLIFFRYRTIHGLAWAHGLYNVLIYLLL